jgi:hypothetical protein
MKRSATAVLATLAIVGLAAVRAQAINPVYTVHWVGPPSGEWRDPNVWKNMNQCFVGQCNQPLLFGQNSGTDGMNNIDPAVTRARNIVIGHGATVEYYWPLAGVDFRVRQGSNLIIKDGATWIQDTDSTYLENGWTRMDPSNLILDNGKFIRRGESAGNDGGGLVIFGSFNDDNNIGRLGSPKINVEIKNGGRIENTGQLWFGTDGESSPDLRVKFTINNGTMDLTGGNTFAINNNELFVNADLAFFYDYSEALGRPHNEEYEINFTGPGSITVDSAGIWVYRQDEFGVWNTGTAGPLSYQDLWNMGILKANGLSGKTGTVPRNGSPGFSALEPANFNDFFTVSGTPGTDNYTLTSINQGIDTVEWVGSSSGEWRDANAWKNTRTNVIGNAGAIFGQNNGTDGMNNINPAVTRARNIVIGHGATVEYYWPLAGGGGDFRVRQGSNLIIKDGATWIQDTDSTYPENGWTRMDPSNLILDNGKFIRRGESAGNDGGGLVIFGSFNDDNNIGRLGSPKINVEIKNGGRIENTGQLWFGTDGESSPDLRVKFTINNGTMDLTGGNTFAINNNELFVNADLAFFYDYSEALGRPHNEEYEINFTGPGSITVDSAGIWVYRQDEFGVWNTGTAGPLSYQDLWNMGILKANGLSGKTGTVPRNGSPGFSALEPANFNDFFSVIGTPGTDDYKLVSLIEATPMVLDGDYNCDGKVDAADYVLWRKNPNSNHGDPEGYNIWRANFGATAGAGSGASANAAVPEPSSVLLLIAAVLGMMTLRSRS